MKQVSVEHAVRQREKFNADTAGGRHRSSGKLKRHLSGSAGEGGQSDLAGTAGGGGSKNAACPRDRDARVRCRQEAQGKRLSGSYICHQRVGRIGSEADR